MRQPELVKPIPIRSKWESFENQNAVLVANKLRVNVHFNISFATVSCLLQAVAIS